MDEQQLQRRIQEFIRRFGLLDHEQTPCGRPLSTSQAHALHILGDVGSTTQRELAARLNLDESTVSRLIDRLVRNDWVMRAIDERNRRQARLTLTAAGQVALDELRQASAAKFRRIQERLPPDKRDMVLASFDLLIAALAEESSIHANTTGRNGHEA